DVLLVDKLQRIEVFHLARDARRELGGVEPRDRPDAALPRAERFPVRPGPDAEWRHEANTRHDDSPAQSPSIYLIGGAPCTPPGSLRCARTSLLAPLRSRLIGGDPLHTAQLTAPRPPFPAHSPTPA